MDLNKCISHYGKSNFSWQQDIHSTIFTGRLYKNVFSSVKFQLLAFGEEDKHTVKKENKNDVLEKYFFLVQTNNWHSSTNALFPWSKNTAEANFYTGFQMSFHKALCTTWDSSQGTVPTPCFQFLWLLSCCTWISQAPNNTVPTVGAWALQKPSQFTWFSFCSYLLTVLGIASDEGGKLHLFSYLAWSREAYCIPASQYPIVWLTVHEHNVLFLLWACLKILWKWDYI